jgi:hypothetical protein
MSRRILALTFYLLRAGIFSLAGLLYILLALVFYLVLFDPRQQTPDVEYYILVIGLFGAVLTFLITLTTAARANRAVHFPFLVRLPSRVEYLTSTFAAAFIFSFVLQALVAFMALVANGPDLSISQFLTIPPLWIAVNVLFAVLALHATDLVAAGWSRVYVFGILAVLLYFQSILDTLVGWAAGILSRLSSFVLNLGLAGLSTFLADASDWLHAAGLDALSAVFGLLFWPFRAIADAAIAGQFNQLQALAPAMLLLYATVLFLLAADLFSTKDLFLSE